VPVATIGEPRDCRAWFVGGMGAVWWILLAQLPVVSRQGGPERSPEFKLASRPFRGGVSKVEYQMYQYSP
jgi:hypothetical protein